MPFESRIYLEWDGRAWRETGSSQPNEADSPAPPTRCEIGSLDPALWRVLAQEIQASALCELEARYDNHLINDADYCVTTFLCDGRRKEVVDCAKQAPKAFQTFEAMVAEVVNRAAWEPFAGDDDAWKDQTGWIRGKG